MTTARIIINLQAKGAKFEIAGDGFIIKAPQGLVTDKLRQELTKRKPDILRLLTHKDSSIETRFFKGLDCPRCQKPVEVITHSLDEEVWLHCVDSECLFKHLKHDKREWCRDCGQKVNVLAGRCVECLKRLLLAPNESCSKCGDNRFWRYQRNKERSASAVWRCVNCTLPPDKQITFFILEG